MQTDPSIKQANPQAPQAVLYAFLGRIYAGIIPVDDLQTVSDGTISASDSYRASFKQQQATTDGNRMPSDVQDIGSDDRAADHEALFGLNVLPYASVYLEPDGMLGGSVSEQVDGFRREAGMELGGSEPPDAVSNEFFLLGQLVGNDPDLLCRFIDTHVFAWFPAFAVAVRAEERASYSHLVDFSLERILEHRHLFAPRPFGQLSEAADLRPSLDDSDTGLVDIANFLTSPARSGIFLSRAGFGRLGREPGLPHGFGSRRQMAVTLLRSAVEYDGMELLIRGLDQEIKRARSTWEAFGHSDLEAARHWSGQWIARLDRSSALLAELIDTLGHLN